MNNYKNIYPYIYKYQKKPYLFDNIILYHDYTPVITLINPSTIINPPNPTIPIIDIISIICKINLGFLH